MALYKGETLLAGSGAGFMPENDGTTGQLLTKTETGYAYCDLPKEGTYVDILVVGGGGGGGCQRCGTGGGGGAGGYFECEKFKLSCHSYYVAIGAYGNGGAASAGASGQPTSFGNAIAVCGGGGGGGGDTSGGYGCNGGSGGGAGGRSSRGTLGGVSLGYGNQGGHNEGSHRGAGGGGAGGPGQPSTCCETYSLGGSAGQGCFSRFFCPGCIFANGGHGGHNCCAPTGILTCKFCGAGGDGNRQGSTGGSGVSGVVMLRYPTDGSYGITCSTGGNKCFTCNGYCYVEFTGNGTFCIVS